MLTFWEAYECIKDRIAGRPEIPPVFPWGIGLMNGDHKRNDSRIVIIKIKDQFLRFQLTDYNENGEVKLFLHPNIMPESEIQKAYWGIVNLTKKEEDFIIGEMDRLWWSRND